MTIHLLAFTALLNFGGLIFSNIKFYLFVKPLPETSIGNSLKELHNALINDLVRFEAHLPSDAEALTEAFERYARVIMLLVRSMDMLTQRENKLLANATSNQKPKEDIIEELERAFNRILAEKETQRSSGDTDT